jgi:hypothetical protein
VPNPVAAAASAIAAVPRAIEPEFGIELERTYAGVVALTSRLEPPV